MDEFDPSIKAATNDMERAQIYFEANDIAEAKKVSTFLSVIGKKTSVVLRDFVSLDNPKDKTRNQLVEVLKQHYKPVMLVIAERFTFHCRCQQPGESVAEFVAELNKMSLNCKFGTYLDNTLCGRLVCGLRSEATQKKLLTEKNLTFKKVLDVAQNNKTASVCAKQLQIRPKTTREQEVQGHLCS